MMDARRASMRGVAARTVIAPTLAAVALAVLALAGMVGQASADDACDHFAWDVTRVRAAFATPVTALAAATAPGTMPMLEPDRLYELTLAPQRQVAFVKPPDKKALPDGAFAGLVHLHVPAAGKYRVAMDNGFWIDVIAGGQFVATDDFTGNRECSAPRKMVQYLLPAGNDLVLQFSGASAPKVRVTLTAAPAP